MGTLRSVYPNMMQILRAGEWEQEQRAEQKADRMLARRKDPVALFEAFYEEVTGETLLAEGKKAVTDIIRELEDCL
ncbi:dNA repair exonuclease [Firmicutes bacterium CAG:534]|nr:dNA repair exonuclease [Firmicutes bacterium CAG:534]